MTVKYHTDLVQGDDAWRDARCGLICASEVKLILSPSLKVADNEKTRTHMWELLAQRITRYVEPSFDGFNILRGREDEMIARDLYSKEYAPVKEVGFITNDRWGFTLGYSPDGLVGDDGLLECKSRIQKYQIATVTTDEVPEEFMFQLQTGMLVSERKWIDFNSFCGGLPMWTKRVYPDPVIQQAILSAAHGFELRISEKRAEFDEAIKKARTVPTVRRIVEEMR